MPHSMASISEKSLAVQGNRVPSAYPVATQEEGRGRQVHHLTYTKFPLGHFQPGEPGFEAAVGPGGLVSLLI